jgi:hypothetical protein
LRRGINQQNLGQVREHAHSLFHLVNIAHTLYSQLAKGCCPALHIHTLEVGIGGAYYRKTVN